MQRLLTSIVNLIVASCDPDEVMLFGSHAKGIERCESDLDFLVIGKCHHSKYLRTREVDDLLSQFPIAIDVLMVTQSELNEDRMPESSFIRSIRIHSVSLYNRRRTEAGRSTIHSSASALQEFN